MWFYWTHALIMVRMEQHSQWETGKYLWSSEFTMRLSALLWPIFQSNLRHASSFGGKTCTLDERCRPVKWLVLQSSETQQRRLHYKSGAINKRQMFGISAEGWERKWLLWNCVTRAPLLHFISSWVALSFKVSESVCKEYLTPVQIPTSCNV